MVVADLEKVPPPTRPHRSSGLEGPQDMGGRRQNEGYITQGGVGRLRLWIAISWLALWEVGGLDSTK